MTRLHTIATAALIAVAPALAAAQGAQSRARPLRSTISADTIAATPTPNVPLTREDSILLAKAKKQRLLYRQIELQHIRPADQRGNNVFESPKADNVPFDGMTLSWGGAFMQEFQGLGHSNTAAPNIVGGVNTNQLIVIGHGFNNAVANLDLGVQLAQGIRLAVTTYASARHHQETWVKDGYILMDASPIDNPLLNTIMENVTVKVGHFELNYGDQHFRRSDNGNAIHNPFVGNLMMDAFTTEIGAEVYYRKSGLLAMGAVTAGEIHGQLTAADKRSPAVIGKLGYDTGLDSTMRFRLTGSIFRQAHAASQTLFTGDRGGSHYYDVLENSASTELANAWSGNIRPGQSDNLTAMVINPFVKLGGFELFGNVETVTGKAATETANRTWNQYDGDLLYRFGPREQLYVGGRYNVVNGALAGVANSVSVNRTAFALGWFVTPALLTKIEYVTQVYNDFPTSDIRHGGKFNGFMIQGAVAF
ncbi:MAG: hypothetical protein JWM95_5147 [Gemmatimonadetes bacterium]|nr:hypothetical protein [Gemmatimonadota bacterium]